MREVDRIIRNIDLNEFEIWCANAFKDPMDGISYIAGLNGCFQKGKQIEGLVVDGLKSVGVNMILTEEGYAFDNITMFYVGDNELIWKATMGYMTACCDDWSNEKELHHFAEHYFQKHPDVHYAFVNMEEYYENEFSLFKIIDRAENYDIIFIKNIDYDTATFLMDYGLPEKVKYIYFFVNEEGKKQMSEVTKHESLELIYLSNNSQYYYKTEGKTGFDLYDNYSEWKRRKDAPTRNSPEYRQMKHRVRKRDNYTCQCCGYYNTSKHNHNLEVHHIYGYNDHLDYRVEDDNCILLCTECHKKYHAIYGRKYVNPSTFSKFIRDYNRYYVNDSVQLTLNESIRSNI